MYHVTGTVITVSLLYLVSFIFQRSGIYTLSTHRKIWNTVLAVSFLITALGGILTAIQINYKWDIPIINSILKWHVETGLCMGVTGIFHLIWHLSYFKKLFSERENRSEQSIENSNPSSITSNLFVVGFTSTSVQLLLIREILNISGGYELITGIFLGSWLIASAAGAFIAGRSKLNDISRINLIFSVSPAISVLFMFILTRLFLETGETPSFLKNTVITLFLLLPFCLVSGFSFVKLISSARKEKNFVPGKSFSIETAGGIAAGIVIPILTSGLTGTYKLLLVILLLTLAYVILTFFIEGRRGKLYIKVLFTVLLSLIILSEPDVFFRQLLLSAVKVTQTKDTPYGNITKGEYTGEESIYYNQRLISYNDDVIEREEDIHYALMQRPNPESVILISGFLESRLQEILKYPVKAISFVEPDPLLAEYALSHPFEGGVELSVQNEDAFRYIRKSDKTADMAILLVPPPSTLSLNRFYTTEFFTDLKKKLNAEGVFMCSPGAADTYLNQESINLYSSIYNSLTAVFKNVTPVGGNKLYFLASDGELSVAFCKLAEERGIENIYVSGNFLSDDLIKNKTNEILSVIDVTVRQNRSVFPIACFHFHSLSFSKTLKEKIPSLILMIMIFALPFLAIRRKNMIMYFSASALSGFEIIVLFLLQLTAGNMYQLTGLIIAALMTGLALGAGTNPRFLISISLMTKAILLAFFYIIAGLSFTLILGLKTIFMPVIVIILLVIIPSYLTGHIFHELTVTQKAGQDAGLTYGADLAGSALGFILISGIIVPAFGIRVSIFSLALLIFAGILLGSEKNK